MPEYVLGIDLGANSVGWAILGLQHGHPDRILNAGVRVFECGSNTDLESGREKDRNNKKRRDARLHRRQLRRHAGRMRHLAQSLQQTGLFPAGNVKSEIDRHCLILELDRELAASEPHDKDEIAAHVHPYRLRARALDEQLPPHAIGRALYHLAQRRGFKSNRKNQRDNDEEKGKVKPAIEGLNRHMAEAGARTLGEYFCLLDPREERIRNRYTSRGMYEAEYEAIWSAQSAYYPDVLTPEAKQSIWKIIFQQRHIRTKKSSIGLCAHEYKHKRYRAPKGFLAAQRFRLLQQVNHAQIITPDEKEVPLTEEQRRILADALERNENLTFAGARKCLGLSKDHKFNIGADEEKFIGNRTSAKLAKVFGDRWYAFTNEVCDRIVDDLLTMESEQALARRGVRAWGLDEVRAAQFAAIKLESGYIRLSRQAIAKLLPLLESGKPYMTAVTEVYGDSPIPPACDKLPPVAVALPALRNPVVSRCLTELRKVVNGIVRQYGKPTVIRVELARDVKNTAKERQRISKQNSQNREARLQAAKSIEREIGIKTASRSDTEKALLALECGFTCPYTGKQFKMRDLFGEAPQYEVEHIIPRSRCLDDSFLNKTLCYVGENRVKGNRTPFEAYGQSPEKWEAVLDRVKRFQGPARDAKLRRFCLETLETLEDFTERQLNDTRYASKEAAGYLGLLYGEAADSERPTKRPVQVSRGKVTADLRNAWRLNEILGDGPRKERGDHRHHAIDAIAIALSDASMIQRVSHAVKLAEKNRSYRWWRNLEMPWEKFLEDVRATVDAIVVSHRPSRDVRGPLHDETLYSKPRELDNGDTVVHKRKPIRALSANEVEDIVDPVVRGLIKNALNGQDPKKAFASREASPLMPARNGHRVPIRCVRVRKSVATLRLGEGPRLRHVVPGANHHIEVLETTDAKGNTKWEARMVPLWEACERLRKKQPVVQRDHGPGKKFIFSLAPGDIFALENANGGRDLFVARSVSRAKTGTMRIEYVTTIDARKKNDIKKTDDWFSGSPNELRKKGWTKVTIGALGEISEAHD